MFKFSEVGSQNGSWIGLKENNWTKHNESLVNLEITKTVVQQLITHQFLLSQKSNRDLLEIFLKFPLNKLWNLTVDDHILSKGENKLKSTSISTAFLTSTDRCFNCYICVCIFIVTTSFSFFNITFAMSMFNLSDQTRSVVTTESSKLSNSSGKIPLDISLEFSSFSCSILFLNSMKKSSKSTSARTSL